MNTERLARIIASIGTALVVGLVIVVLSATYLNVHAIDKKQENKADITLLEEFVEVVETSSLAKSADKEDTSSHLDETVQMPSQPAPASGTDLEDRGPVAEAPKPVSTPEPSPVKVKKDKPKNTGAAEDKKKKEEEEVRRKANNEVANAFKNASGKHNSATSATEDKGNSGNKNADPSAQGTTGTGRGKVGGGWIMPVYAQVPSTVTGSVTLTVKIDATGRVTSVNFSGGTPPAATNAALRSAIEREVRARKFSRASYDDAQPATAYITYTFK